MSLVLVQNNDTAHYQQAIKAGSHLFTADVPKDKGGEETGPNPHELLLGALGACTSITLQMYAKKKEWDLKNVSIELSEEEVDDPDNAGKKISKISRNITVAGDLSAEQIESLKTMADKCPIHKILQGAKTIETAINKN